MKNKNEIIQSIINFEKYLQSVNQLEYPQYIISWIEETLLSIDDFKIEVNKRLNDSTIADWYGAFQYDVDTLKEIIDFNKFPKVKDFFNGISLVL